MPLGARVINGGVNGECLVASEHDDSFRGRVGTRLQPTETYSDTPEGNQSEMPLNPYQ